MRFIDNIDDLDKEIERVNKRFEISDDEGRKALSEFHFVVKDLKLPDDPYSKNYYDAQMALYSKISGRENYSPTNEETVFEFNKIKDKPFPYSTHSPITVGDQLLAQGFIIKTMNLPPKSRILEFGPGWGNTTLHLVQMGYQLAVVEIEKRFIDLIRYRTKMYADKIRLIHKDMVDFSLSTKEKFDAVLFFESFHHCSDHITLLQNLYNIVVDNGVICFASEPIVHEPYEAFPYPWGVRLDGMSVWSTRKMGWLELGYELSYFLRTLLILGFVPRIYTSDISPLTKIIIASKSTQIYKPNEISLPPDECITWASTKLSQNIDMRYSLENSVMSCKKDLNVRHIQFCLSNDTQVNLRVTLSAGSVTKRFIIPRKSSNLLCEVPVEHWDGRIKVSSQTWKPHNTFNFKKNNKKRGVGVIYFHIST